jgi:hypothetical protein
MHQEMSVASPPPVSTAALWTGRILSALPIPLLLMSAAMKLANAAPVVEGFRKFGFPDGAAFAIGLVELACVILYVVPQTAVLGAILLTGYLGGAAVTHIRVSESWIAPVIMGVILWVGLYLRDPRLRELAPWRTLK